MLFLIVLLVLAVLVILYFIGIYNNLITLRQQVNNAWSQIDIQLKRRHDLIPNLVNAVRGYMEHERETLTHVVAARSKAVSSNTINDKIKAEEELTSALGRLLLVVENYPNLKADQNFTHLQEELVHTENNISFARQHYNDSAMLYNQGIAIFPQNIVAQRYNFKSYDYFKITDEKEKQAPEVKFK